MAVEWGRLNHGGFSESGAGWLEQCRAGMAVSCGDATGLFPGGGS